VGTLFTQDRPTDTGPCTPTSNSNNPTSSTKSVSTTITIEELDQNMSKVSTEVAEIKNMLIEILQSRNNNNGNQTHDHKWKLQTLKQ
jgi:hypothetical protein